MPIYEFYCDSPKCKHRIEITLTFDQLDKFTTPDCPRHNLPLLRQYSVPHLAGSSGGQILPESTLLKNKQEQRKMRSRAHFKNEVLPKIKDPHAIKHFNKKFKNTKKVDHEKL